MGIIPAQFFDPGSIGVVSKSGTLTYQIGNELKQAGAGNSSIVGIGGDPIVGSDFIDILTLFEADDETELIVMVGEIGGDAEERAADFIAEQVSKPVVAYIAGFTAPPGKQMGHAGAIISGSSGTAEAKKEALEASGVRVGRSPDRDRPARRRGDRRAGVAPAIRPGRRGWVGRRTATASVVRLVTLRVTKAHRPMRSPVQRTLGAVPILAAMAAEVISFARGAPSADILPAEAVREAAQRALADDWKRALSYGTGVGHPGLCEWIAERHGLGARRR